MSLIPLTKPDRARTILYWKVVGTGLSLFFLVYFSALHLAAARDVHYALFFEFERQLPLIPWMIIPYISIIPLLFLPWFTMDARALRSLLWSFNTCTLLAGAIFVIFPGKVGFPGGQDFGSFSLFYDGLYALDKPHNLFPSLHVAYSALVVMTVSYVTHSRFFDVVLWVWWVFIITSVVFTHQHHIPDILTGAPLALFSFKFVFLRKMAQ